MKVTLEDLDPKLLIQTRSQTRELHAKVNRIINDEELHYRLLKLAEFELPAEADKAYQQKVNMVNYYGKDSSTCGLTFSVAHSVDGTEDYLGVVYDPQEIVEGAWEVFQLDKQERAQQSKARQEAKKIEAKVRAQEIVAAKNAS